MNEESLVEARITWDIGNHMGVKVSNNEHFIVALCRLDKNNDEETKRKRGRPKKRKDAAADA